MPSCWGRWGNSSPACAGEGDRAVGVVEGKMLVPRRATVTKARSLRRSMTLPEVVLWKVLRARPAGIKFRRQHPVGPYVLDFYCEAALTGIEVDGMAHDMGENPLRDA